LIHFYKSLRKIELWRSTYEDLSDRRTKRRDGGR